MVPTFTADRSMGSVPGFSPAGLSTTTPQPFIVAPDHRTAVAEAVAPGCRGLRRTAIPAIHQVPSRSHFLRGFHHRFLHSYTSPSR